MKSAALDDALDALAKARRYTMQARRFADEAKCSPAVLSSITGAWDLLDQARETLVEAAKACLSHQGEEASR